MYNEHATQYYVTVPNIRPQRQYTAVRKRKMQVVCTHTNTQSMWLMTIFSKEGDNAQDTGLFLSMWLWVNVSLYFCCYFGSDTCDFIVRSVNNRWGFRHLNNWWYRANLIHNLGVWKLRTRSLMSDFAWNKTNRLYPSIHLSGWMSSPRHLLVDTQ